MDIYIILILSPSNEEYAIFIYLCQKLIRNFFFPLSNDHSQLIRNFNLYFLSMPFVFFFFNIKLYNTRYDIDMMHRMVSFGLEDYAKKYGALQPSQFVDFLALAGDQVDNIPGSVCL